MHAPTTSKMVSFSCVCVCERERGGGEGKDGEEDAKKEIKYKLVLELI